MARGWLGKLWTIPNVLILGLAIRFALAPLSGQPWDVYVWYTTGESVVSWQALYSVPGYSYPPTWAGILGGVTLVYNPLAAALHVHPWTYVELRTVIGPPFNLGAPLVPDGVFTLLVKTPIILADLGIALLLGRVVGQRFGRPDLSKYAVTLFFLNPLVIWISSVWGMFDALPTYAMLAGTLLLLDDRYLLSGMVFGVAISLKYFPVVVLGALFFGLGPKFDRRWAWLFLGAGAVLVAVSLPFLLTNAASYIAGVTAPAGGGLRANFALWSLFYAVGPGRVSRVVSFVDLGAIAGLIVVLATVMRKWASTLPDPTRWVDLSLMGVLAFFALARNVDEQFIVWIVPYLTLLLLLRHDRGVVLFTVTTVTLLSIWAKVKFYSFFLPTVTLDPSLAPYIPQFGLLNIPDTVFTGVMWATFVGTLVYLLLIRYRGRFRSARWERWLPLTPTAPTLAGGAQAVELLPPKEATG